LNGFKGNHVSHANIYLQSALAAEYGTQISSRALVETMRRRPRMFTRRKRVFWGRSYSALAGMEWGKVVSAALPTGSVDDTAIKQIDHYLNE